MYCIAVLVQPSWLTFAAAKCKGLTMAKLPNFDLLHHLCALQEPVAANCSPDSEVAKAFRIFEDQFGRENGPTWGCVYRVMKAWNALVPAEQSRIMNGWRPQKTIMNVEMLLQEMQQHADGESVSWFLNLECGTDGTILVAPDYQLDHGSTCPVIVAIKEGTDKATALAGLKAAIATLEAQWDRAVQLADNEYFFLPEREQKVPHAA